VLAINNEGDYNMVA